MTNIQKLLIMITVCAICVTAIFIFEIPAYIGFPILLAINLYMPNSKWGRMDG